MKKDIPEKGTTQHGICVMAHKHGFEALRSLRCKDPWSMPSN